MPPRVLTTFQDRLAIALQRCGGRERGQSELARRINERYKMNIKPQTIQYLTDRKRPKPATSSRLTPLIAEVTGIDAHWLATGEASTEQTPQPTSGKPYRTAQPHNPRSTDSHGAQGMPGMAEQAVELVIAWRALPERRRREIKAQVEAEAIAWNLGDDDDYSPRPDQQGPKASDGAAVREPSEER